MTRKLQSLFPRLLAIICISSSAFAETCPQSNLGEYLAHEEPKIKKIIEKLSPNQMLNNGIQLCDGEVLFKKWRYLGKAKNLKQGQQVFLFKDDGAIKAIAWVESDGVSLPIPTCSECSEEGQYVLSNDVYTWKDIQPERSEGGAVVIIDHPLPEWIQSIAKGKQ